MGVSFWLFNERIWRLYKQLMLFLSLASLTVSNSVNLSQTACETANFYSARVQCRSAEERLRILPTQTNFYRYYEIELQHFSTSIIKIFHIWTILRMDPILVCSVLWDIWSTSFLFKNCLVPLDVISCKNKKMNFLWCISRKFLSFQ